MARLGKLCDASHNACDGIQRKVVPRLAAVDVIRAVRGRYGHCMRMHAVEAMIHLFLCSYSLSSH